MCRITEKKNIVLYEDRGATATKCFRTIFNSMFPQTFALEIMSNKSESSEAGDELLAVAATRGSRWTTVTVLIIFFESAYYLITPDFLTGGPIIAKNDQAITCGRCEEQFVIPYNR